MAVVDVDIAVAVVVYMGVGATFAVIVVDAVVAG